MYPEVQEYLDEAENLIELDIGEKVRLELLNNLEHLLFKIWEAGYELGVKDSITER